MNTTKLDGRTARLERNRAAIVRAQVEHVRETGKLATADEVAERANVSQRSVYRIFGDKVTLLREATNYVYRQLAERFPFPQLSGLPLRERVYRVVDHLASIYEFITPMKRVLAKSEVDDELALEERELVRARYLARIRDGFSDLVLPEEPLPVRLRAFALIASWNAWEYLRSEAKLTVEGSKEVIAHTIAAVLMSAASEGSPQTFTEFSDGQSDSRPTMSSTQEGDET